MMKWLKRIGILIVLLATGPILSVTCGNVRLGQDWRTADRNPAGLAAAIGPRTKAVIPVHFAGRPCAMGDILAIARRH